MQPTDLSSFPTCSINSIEYKSEKWIKTKKYPLYRIILSYAICSAQTSHDALYLTQHCESKNLNVYGIYFETVLHI